MDKGKGEYWFICTRNRGDPGDDRESLQKLRNEVGSLATVFSFELPGLRVGTLEKLMSAADLLKKVDMAVEGVVRKIERQFHELNVKTGKQLSIEGQPVLTYLENFRWKSAKYPQQRAVNDLIRNIQAQMIKTENELKDSISYCSEKSAAVTILERQKDGNLMVANLDQILTPLLQPFDQDRYETNMVQDTEYLKTVVIIVSSSLEKEFLQTYESIGKDLVGYGPEGDRTAVKGSPVVPGSAFRVTEDRDGYCAYIVTILKKFEEEFGNAVQRSKFLMRPYDFESAYNELERIRLEGDNKDPYTLACEESDKAQLELLGWCLTHYGDAFMAWIHIKAISLFVEAILRYGLPCNFAAALLHPTSGSEKKLREKLAVLYADHDRSGLMNSAANAESGLEESFAYVSDKIIPQVE